jgi:hypothetical protein
MLAAASAGRSLMGGVMAEFGLLILAGVDKAVEIWRVDGSPMWLTRLTTRY